MKINFPFSKFAIGCAITIIAPPTLAANVKVTPLGSQDGEFCPQDQAMIFEAPIGASIHHDAMHTVAGENDSRLGKIDITLVSHMHSDHEGNSHNKAPNSGSCDHPDISVSDLPDSSAVNIARAKSAKIVTSSETLPFFANRPKTNGGELGKSVRDAGITSYVGEATGYIVKVSNGLWPINQATLA